MNKLTRTIEQGYAAPLLENLVVRVEHGFAVTKLNHNSDPNKPGEDFGEENDLGDF